MTQVAEQTRTDAPRTWNAPARGRDLPTRVFRTRDALDVLEQHRLSPAELRILLALREGDMELYELARSFKRRSIDVRRAAARLYARGLLRWRYKARPGMSRKDEVLGITGAGSAVIR